MERRSIVTLIIFISSLAFAETYVDTAVGSNAIFGETTDTIEVGKGDEFTVALNSNKTTGYEWQLAEPLDEEMLEFINSKYVKEEGVPLDLLVGTGGEEQWTFKARNLGKTTISFKYIRSWEKDIPPAKTKSFTVMIKEQPEIQERKRKQQQLEGMQREMDRMNREVEYERTER